MYSTSTQPAPKANIGAYRRGNLSTPMPVLAREHSDFAWFKSRTDSLPFDLSTGQSNMANANGHSVLNAETSEANERAENHLPAKSYAEATRQSYENQQTANSYAMQTGGYSDTGRNVNGSHLAGTEEKQLEHRKVVYAKHFDNKGTAVASVKPDPGYEAALEHNQLSAPRQRKKEIAPDKTKSPEKRKLASGRRAGAGWERSAYVCLHF